LANRDHALEKRLKEYVAKPMTSPAIVVAISNSISE
jgi:hypothetical protein